MERIEDMPLTDSEMNQVERCAERYGMEEAEKMALSIQSGKYRDKFLEMKRVSSSSRMCYSTGTDQFVRKDGQPINEEDIRAVDFRRIGQGHSVKGVPGGMDIVHEWSVDSSD